MVETKHQREDIRVHSENSEEPRLGIGISNLAYFDRKYLFVYL